MTYILHTSGSILKIWKKHTHCIYLHIQRKKKHTHKQSVCFCNSLRTLFLKREKTHTLHICTYTSYIVQRK